MEKINFENNPNLGKVVSKVNAFCKLTRDFPPLLTKENEATLMSFFYDYVVGAFNNPKFHGLAGHKWSRLCGFTFTSSINEKNPTFQFVYVPKLRGALTRNWHGLHGWYCWQYVALDNRKVMSIDDMMNTYQFSINDFVHSDIFEHYVPKFVANVRYALSHNIKDILVAIKDPNKSRELSLYIKAISTSLDEIYQVQKLVIDGEYSKVDRKGTYAAGSEPKLVMQNLHIMPIRHMVLSILIKKLKLKKKIF